MIFEHNVKGKFPFEKFENSKTPIGPFHIILFAKRISFSNKAALFGPISSPIESSGILKILVVSRNFVGETNSVN